MIRRNDSQRKAEHVDESGWAISQHRVLIDRVWVSHAISPENWLNVKKTSEGGLVLNDSIINSTTRQQVSDSAKSRLRDSLTRLRVSHEINWTFVSLPHLCLSLMLFFFWRPFHLFFFFFSFGLFFLLITRWCSVIMISACGSTRL